MRHRPSLPVVFLCGLGILAAAGATLTAQFKSGVELVPLTVTVADRAGRYVPDLTAAHFAVFEEGRPQPLSYFAPAHAPVDVAFLIDTSGSMRQDLSIVQEAACGLARRLTPEDRAAVASVASTLTMPQPMTADMSQVQRAIRTLNASGNTALYEGIYVLLRNFERSRGGAAVLRRQAIVMLSDGIDTVGRVRFEDVLELARRADVMVYVITLPPPPASDLIGLTDRRISEAAFALRSLAGDSGGRVFTTRDARELPAIYEAIASELGNQYLLGYDGAGRGENASFRRISVRVEHPQVAHVRTRAGYYTIPERAGVSAPRTGQ